MDTSSQEFKDLIKTMRNRTGCPLMECRFLLIETNGDLEKAIRLLWQRYRPGMTLGGKWK